MPFPQNISSSDTEQHQPSVINTEWIIVFVMLLILSIFALICLIGEITFLVKFGNDECLNREVRLTSLMQVFVGNIICYFFVWLGSLWAMIKMIIETRGYKCCNFEKYNILFFVLPAVGFISAGAFSVTELYVFAYMTGKGVCKDNSFVAFVATTVAIKLFIMIVTIGGYIMVQESENYSIRNSLNASNRENNTLNNV